MEITEYFYLIVVLNYSFVVLILYLSILIYSCSFSYFLDGLTQWKIEAFKMHIVKDEVF